MKTLYLILFLCFVYSCWTALVVKVPMDKNEASKKSIFTLDSDLQIPNQIVFCVRFKFKSSIMPTYIINSKSKILGLWFFLPEFGSQFGHALVNKEEFLFKVPTDFLQPFSWHNLCFNLIGEKNKSTEGKQLTFIKSF